MTSLLTDSQPIDAAESAASGLRAVIFDLDGTLVDPAGAITGGISFALAQHGVEVPDQERLNAFVGPPLATSLSSLPGVTEEMIPSIVEQYRQRYLDEGMQASRVYPGITELLTELNSAGVTCAVATSKPTGLAERLLSVQGIREQFAAVHGSHEDESIPHVGKGPIVAAAMAAIGLPPGLPSASQTPEHTSARVVMVGDRIFDVDGAAANGLSCIGVHWGYAPEGELAEAGASPLVSTASELRRALVSAGILPRISYESQTPGSVKYVAPRGRQTLD